MDNTFDLQIRDNHIMVKCSGPYNKEGKRENIRKVLEFALEHNRPRILFDLIDITGHPTVLDRVEFAVDLSSLALNLPRAFAQIAVVGRPPVVHPNRVAEAVAIKCGINVKVFEDCGEAEEWIGAKLPPAPEGENQYHQENDGQVHVGHEEEYPNM